MKKIDFEKLGEYISEKATKEFDKWYSSNIRDYMDDITYNGTDDEGLDEYYVELTKVGKQPLIIKFYTDNEDNYYI